MVCTVPSLAKMEADDAYRWAKFRLVGGIKICPDCGSSECEAFRGVMYAGAVILFYRTQGSAPTTPKYV